MNLEKFDGVGLAKSQVTALITDSINKAMEKGSLKQAEIRQFVVEIPQDLRNGDYSSNVAMVNSKVFGSNPRAIATAILENMDFTGTFFERAELAGPGFINFFLSREYFSTVVKAVLENKENYGKTNFGAGKKYNVEFVSANPTGPMHLGNARGGALGDILAEVLSWSGYDVTREFLINDAGNQIEKFGMSLEARYMQLFDESYPFDDSFYQGGDIKQRAEEFKAIHGDAYVSASLEERKAALVKFALPLNIQAMKDHLGKYRIDYDVWFSEQEMRDKGDVEKAIAKLTENGYTYEKEGALWYKGTALGEEKDEVLVRANGISTYFAADIAYHYDKLVTRGFDKAIDVWGADHHGHVARMKTAMTALGLDAEQLDVVLMQLVKLVGDARDEQGNVIYDENGKPKKTEIRMSKRTGKAIQLVDLLDEIPIDAARFFFNLREPNTHLIFDLDLAIQENSENPVYYVQYAHARICSILRQLEEAGLSVEGVENADLSLLVDPAEIELIRTLSLMPGEIIAAGKAYDPSKMPKYAISLATQFHRFYSACRVKGEDENLSKARLALCVAARHAIANCLTIMNITVPEKM
ncbi:MAG: arginine--tRNA ligase [Oscillospiraceae bacterium]|nr:arginine--tRNA ligase [Oscillospiraceae bacterium]